MNVREAQHEFPLTQLVIRLSGRKAGLSKGNPLNGLAMQIAFTVPLLLPVILALAAHDPNWFFPAFMLVVGAHYLPFIFLYGMWQYGILAVLLIGGAMIFRALLPDGFYPGAWFSGVVLVGFGLAMFRQPAAPPRPINPQP